MPYLDVTVVNDGRQPTALAAVHVRAPSRLRVQIWLRLGPLRRVLLRWQPHAYMDVRPKDEIEAAVVLRPGDPHTARFDGGAAS